jgi:hypothetical protein
MREARAWRIMTAAALAGMAGAATAVAEPLAKEACDAAATERAGLIAAGIPDTVRKGPTWAKDNLPPEKLKAVERYLALEEDLLFKCGEAKLRALPASDDDDGPVAAKDAAAQTGAEQPSVPKRKSPAKKVAAPKGEANAGSLEKAVAPKSKARPRPETSAAAAEPGATPKPAAKARPKPKPKVDDAFRPPKPIPLPTPD